jgi:hypothetical protein
MLLRDKDKPIGARVLILLSLVAIGLAGVGALGEDIVLASTQWLLVAIMLGVLGIYLLLEAIYRS